MLLKDEVVLRSIEDSSDMPTSDGLNGNVVMAANVLIGVSSAISMLEDECTICMPISTVVAASSDGEVEGSSEDTVHTSENDAGKSVSWAFVSGEGSGTREKVAELLVVPRGLV